jgi:hypothetical protein
MKSNATPQDLIFLSRALLLSPPTFAGFGSIRSIIKVPRLHPQSTPSLLLTVISGAALTFLPRHCYFDSVSFHRCVSLGVRANFSCSCFCAVAIFSGGVFAPALLFVVPRACARLRQLSSQLPQHASPSNDESASSRCCSVSLVFSVVVWAGGSLGNVSTWRLILLFCCLSFWHLLLHFVTIIAFSRRGGSRQFSSGHRTAQKVNLHLFLNPPFIPFLHNLSTGITGRASASYPSQDGGANHDALLLPTSPHPTQSSSQRAAAFECNVQR